MDLCKFHLNGDEIYICLFGGCLLITYVPLSPSMRVRTPPFRKDGTLRSEAEQ
ncbi:hypothetical protein L208DRAFT_86967 [Tricholoma matsutake]|nr:hypothetical protein L208DRAFT_86967 [Tricholoma matsutake 945]